LKLHPKDSTVLLIPQASRDEERKHQLTVNLMTVHSTSSMFAEYEHGGFRSACQNVATQTANVKYGDPVQVRKERLLD